MLGSPYRTRNSLGRRCRSECQHCKTCFPHLSSYPSVLSCWPPQPPRVQCSGKGIVDSLPDWQAMENTLQRIETRSPRVEGYIVKLSHTRHTRVLPAGIVQPTQDENVGARVLEAGCSVLLMVPKVVSHLEEGVGPMPGFRMLFCHIVAANLDFFGWRF